MLYLLAMPVVRLPGFLSEAEQQAVHALAEYTRATAPEVWATDALGLVEEEEWRTTFLNQRLPDLLPQVAAIISIAISIAIVSRRLLRLNVALLAMALLAMALLAMALLIMAPISSRSYGTACSAP